MMAQTAPSSAPAATEPAPQPPAAQPQAIPEAEVAPAQQAAEAAPQAAAPPPVAATPPKPAPAAKAHRAPQSAAPHAPPAQVSAAGHFRVQFGAFANEENARRVRSALEAAGLKAAISREAGASGNPLFIVRSPAYPDRAAALSAAQNVQNRAKHLATPIAIDYAIIPDRAAGEQHAQR
jgi:cell division protein FtsN